MSSPEPFAIELRRTSYKDATIEYREPGRTLEIDVEMSGVPQYDYVGLDTAFTTWTHPSQTVMSDAERSTVRARLEEWAASKRLRLGFGPPVPLEELLKGAIASGSEIVHGTDTEGRPTIILRRVQPPVGRNAAWQPYREPLRVALTRTVAIALLAGAIASPSFGGIRRWPVLSLLMLWPSFGGHWIDLLFLNVLRPRLPEARFVQTVARFAVWFLGGIVLALGLRLTAMLLLDHAPFRWLTWFVAGVGFVAIELVAHAALQIRGRPSFYNGRG